MTGNTSPTSTLSPPTPGVTWEIFTERRRFIFDHLFLSQQLISGLCCGYSLRQELLQAEDPLRDGRTVYLLRPEIYTQVSSVAMLNSHQSSPAMISDWSSSWTSSPNSQTYNEYMHAVALSSTEAYALGGRTYYSQKSTRYRCSPTRRP